MKKFKVTWQETHEKELEMDGDFTIEEVEAFAEMAIGRKCLEDEEDSEEEITIIEFGDIKVCEI